MICQQKNKKFLKYIKLKKYFVQHLITKIKLCIYTKYLLKMKNICTVDLKILYSKNKNIQNL